MIDPSSRASTGDTVAIVMAACSGFCFALIPIAIRGATSQGIDSNRLLAISMLICGAILLPRAIAADTPWFIWLAGGLIGLAQLGAIAALRLGLSHGPLTPLWCAQSVSFVVVTLWSWWQWDDKPSTGGAVGILLGFMSVGILAWGAGDDKGGKPTRILPYAIALMLVLALNGITNASFKTLAMLPIDTSDNLMAKYGDGALTGMYAVIGISSFLLRPINHGPMPFHSTIGMSVVLAGGSLGGISLLRLCLTDSTALVFTVNATSSLLAAAILAWLLWGERPSPIGAVGLLVALAAVFSVEF